METKFSKKDKIIYSIITVLLVWFCIEWIGRIYVSYRDYTGPSPSVEVNLFSYNYYKLHKQDLDIGHYIDTDTTVVFESDEFRMDINVIDIGVDSLRFRDDGIDPDRGKKILALGDSFTMGFWVQLEETFPERLEQMDGDLDVINAGITGHTPQQYTRVLKRFVKSGIDFDAVLYSFYSGNDVRWEHTFREWDQLIQYSPDIATVFYFLERKVTSKTVFESDIEKRSGSRKVHNIGPMESFLQQWFVTFRMARRGYHLIAGNINLRAFFVPSKVSNVAALRRKDWVDTLYALPGEVVIVGSNGERVFMGKGAINQVSGETLARSRENDRAIYLLNYPLVLESVIEAKMICDSLNRPFFFVYVPSKPEIYADAVAEAYDEDGTKNLRQRLHHLHDELLYDLDSLGIDVIDLTDEFIAREREGLQCYFNIDEHFNVNGHRLWAEVIYRSIN